MGQTFATGQRGAFGVWRRLRWFGGSFLFNMSRLLFDQRLSLLSHSVCLLTSAAPDSAASGGSALLNLDFFGPVEDSGSTSSASMPGQHLLLLILPLLHLTCNLHQTSTQFHFLFSSVRLLKVQLPFAATRGSIWS